MIALREANHYSEEKVEIIRSELPKVIDATDLAVVTVGSFGRREASIQSDLDFFLIERSPGVATSKEIEAVRNAISSCKIKLPSADGAFNSHIELCTDMAKKIGGFDDTTQKLTRRLLFLLEGDWLCNKALFDECFERLIQQYVRDTITEHQLCRFLLNDLIRYYRTICVDFEYKTYEDGKAWGDRNIKLQFSRKLLYFSGVLVVAETLQHRWEVKRDILRKYLRLTPTERLKTICGAQSEKALLMYDEFLEQLSSEEVRDMLKRTREDRKTHSPEFRTFKNKGHHFTFELSRLLAATYEISHPIHAALKF
jgi:rubrerythrin